MNKQTASTDEKEAVNSQLTVASSHNDTKDLESLMERAHKGLHGVFDAMEALMEIRNRKLYLTLQDKNGKPRYRTFDVFLKDEFGYARSNFCRLQNAYKMKLQVEEKLGKSTSEVMKAIPLNVSTFYELSMISSNQLDAALSDFTQDAANNIPITASYINKWRKDHQQKKHRVLPDITVPHEVTENNSSFKTAANIAPKEDDNTVEEALDEVRSYKSMTANIHTAVKTSVASDSSTIVEVHNDTTEAEAQDDNEMSDDDVAEQIRKNRQDPKIQ